MINYIPFFGWGMALFFNISLAIPFWFVWSVCGVGEKYFFFLPPVWQQAGFWASVGIFTVVSIIKVVFVPKLVSIDNSNTAD